MTLFATEGQHAWRLAPSADVASLVNLPEVQKQLTKSTTLDIDRDSELNAITAAVNEAIERLPQPLRDAALEQFGFTDPSPETPRKKGARENEAAEKLGISKRTYEVPSTKYGGASPRDHLVGLVADALCEPLHPTARRSPTRYRVMALVGGAVILCGVVLAVTLPRRGRDIRSSTVNVGSPRHIEHLPGLSAEPMDGTGGLGATIQACALAGCHHTSATRPLRPQLGEIVTFKLGVNDTYRRPVATMTLVASTTINDESADVNIAVGWKPPLATNATESRTSGTHVEMPLATTSGLPHLEYVAGSTELYETVTGSASEEVPILHLPDGLFSSSGITLTNAGSARECQRCTPFTVATIHFEMRVTVVKL